MNYSSFSLRLSFSDKILFSSLVFHYFSSLLIQGGSLLSVVISLDDEMRHLDNKKNNNFLIAVAIIFTLALMVASSMPAIATTQQPPVTAATDNESVNVLINWEPTEIEPNQDIEFTFDFLDPSSGESIPHVNYNFEIIDENNGETIQSMTDLHTHSGSDVQTVMFDTTGSFRLVVTIIGTGINPPFDTTQSGTAERAIMVGQETPVAPSDGNTAATTTDDTTTTEEAARNNNSDPTLGSLFLTEEAELTSFNPINETYIEISFVGNATIMPPNATTTINATETGNATLNIQPNGVTFAQGQGFLVTEDDGAAEENATASFVELSRVEPDGTGSGTGVVFFSTNSTGQLSFLDNMVGIFQHEISPEGDTIREWEWKSGTLPFENNGGGTATTGN
jgi:hypothetical protein